MAYGNSSDSGILRSIDINHSANGTEVRFTADMEQLRKVAELLLAGPACGAEVEEVVVSVKMGSCDP